MKDGERQKVLIVTGVLWIGGGAEKVAANLGNYFTDQGYETHLLTFYEAPNKYPYHGVYHSLNESPKTAFQKIFRVPQRIWKISQYARKHDIDLAYTFLEEANFYTLAAKLLFYRKLDVIVSVRNNINKRGRLFKGISKFLYPFAKKVVSVTKAVEHTLQTDFKLTNTTTIYNSIDVELVTEKAAEPLLDQYQALFESRPVLITAGRLIQQKGQWHLIRAFSEVAKEHPTATLIILGEGEYRPQLEQLINDAGLSENVHLIGNQPNVYQFLSRADLFVFSSLWEGMPNTMLEALSVGLPIISTDCVSGPREIIAPDISVTQQIAYPYETEYGTLVKAPENLRPVWKPKEEAPLSLEEAQLAGVIASALDRKLFKGTEYTVYKNRINEAFEKSAIMQQWESLLQDHFFIAFI
jgi:glycosyltransferase involved in cell wall biosynthesis